jgi:glycosyltransferase involved in cell wall biosynthesis
MALVSIVTPSYNQASFLEQTIQSVLDQEGVSIEYLIVDGGSTDGSVEIIRRYSDRLAWWVSEGDAGQADAINKGLQRAKGEIVAWLNSDDLYLPGALAQAVAAFQAYPEAGLVFGDAITIDPIGRQIGQLVFGNWGLDELMRFRIICQPAVFMRRSALEQAGYLDPAYHYMLDHQLWLRIACLCPIYHIPHVLAQARHHPGAKNVAQPDGFSRETLRLLAWMEIQPGLASHLAANRRRIEAGAYRLSARYLLDGDQPGRALRDYGRALVRNPGYALQHWHRMLFAVLSLLGGKKLADIYYRLRRAT